MFSANTNLRVLAYHTVPSSEKFDGQIQYLIKNYNVISIKDLYQHIFIGKSLPSRAVLITFDDGDISVLENGLSVLEKYDLPSVLFVITDLIDSSNTFWCRWVEKIYEKKGRSYKEAREKVNSLKNIPNKERMEYLNNLEKAESRQLKSAELQILQSKKMVIGNHTHTHPMINNCTKQEIEQELEATKSLFKKWDLEGYPFFAYPNGNWDAKSEKILKEKGVEMAFLFDHQINKNKINPLRISRIRVDADTELNEFKVKVSGLHSKIMSLR
ncbi:polysaccharide deacetylase family protein [Autumnicola edwardsiae]|uniref:Polysaccharide deacetylase family protein n=1 Tax=Autumnicola edwardsiae TaxID=3075594 RepID=A0ABU3CTF4_9FLAO|nr:polysaccharide deacetylase family protein [Zunongwangia sp. F297]MDT0649637.1 polysaccharide deacetylase family protein [Zunongwangia sp. F297]